jgi:hypothetical protein
VDVWLTIVTQIDAAQSALLKQGGDTSRAVSELTRTVPCSHKRARRLVLAAKLRMRRESTHTTREQTRDMLRATFREAIRLSIGRTRAVTVGVGLGLTEVEHVRDPDVRSLIEAAKALAVLDEADPRSTVQMLAAWERNAGLDGTAADRNATLHAHANGANLTLGDPATRRTISSLRCNSERRTRGN